MEKLLDSLVYNNIRNVNNVGAELSGGLDSAIVSLILAKFTNKLNTYGILLTDDDLKRQVKKRKAILNNIQGKDYAIRIDQYMSLETNTNSFFNSFEWPEKEIYSYHVEKLASKAKRDKIATVLTGIGGDELMSLTDYVPAVDENINEKSIKEHIIQRFMPGENYREAEHQFNTKLENNSNTYSEGVIDYFHKQYKSASDSASSLSDTSSNLNLFDKGASPITEAKIQMNGQDRITFKDYNYFNIIQPYQHHTNIPAIGINIYSFSLYPEDFQPSGSCNYSVIDSSYLLFKITNESIINQRKCYIRIYATNYNIFNISTGIGRLSYNK